MSVTGIVLAGGRASRFGGPKLAADLHGRSILAHAVAAIEPLVDEIILAGPAPDPPLEPGAGTPLRPVPDLEPFAGPLPALAGALREAGGQVALIVGGDMPMLVPAVLRALLDQLADAAAADSAIELVQLAPPVDPGDADDRARVLPFACRVAPAVIEAERALRAGDRSLRGLLSRLPGALVPAAIWTALDPEARTLVDVDTPAELERLRASPSVGGLLG